MLVSWMFRQTIFNSLRFDFINSLIKESLKRKQQNHGNEIDLVLTKIARSGSDVLLQYLNLRNNIFYLL